ncbi:rhodanese-like domain-containing protein [Marinigracilibium pacificum]|uniref:Rhodanese-like domain-containing protein n=1 Tax=Marinigracilibium pacificum TaxID=2729599 RepID=A0A848J1A1_9BACT|nr:rhodanese-like domain-containing protein [Marinigracilibium pacificum]NMM49295.1 rhodanese-like domain-containing protein [Marinigracilibium pacificum]
MNNHLSPREYLDLVENNSQLITFDVREKWEHEELPFGDLNISVYELPNILSQVDQYKNNDIVVCCKTGKRGLIAMKILRANGFKSVKNLSGGITALNELKELTIS